MNTMNHLSEEDLALLALQLLPEEETQTAWTHVLPCEACRKELGALQGDLAFYSLALDMEAPPASARERLLQQVAAEKRVSPNGSQTVHLVETSVASNASEPLLHPRPADVLAFPARSAARTPRSGFALWSGWAVAAGFAAAAGLQFQHRQKLQSELASEHAQLAEVQQSAAASQTALSALTDPAALNVALQQPAPQGTAAQRLPEGHAAYLPDRGALVFVATDLQPLKPYKVYELWLLPAEKGQTPIPAASFRPDAAGNASVILPTGPRLVSIKGFGVTMEDDKTPAQKPTLPILLMGTSKS